MSHSFLSVPIHFVFSTKDRVRQLTPDFEHRLWGYLAACGQGKGLDVHAVGGHENHIHILASLPATQTIASAIQRLKQASSRWMHESMPARPPLYWQVGYGAFGVGYRGIAPVSRYIRNQHIHHRSRSFEGEFETYLRENQMPFDPRSMWG